MKSLRLYIIECFQCKFHAWFEKKSLSTEPYGV